MADRRFDTLLTGGSSFGAPRWHDGRWWVSDRYRHCVLTVTPQGLTETVMEVPAQPSGLGWQPDGALYVVSMEDRRLWRRDPGGAVELVADLGPWCGGHADDMVVDATGRAYVGDVGFDLIGGDQPRAAALLRVDRDGSVTVAADGLHLPGGAVITPDGATLVVAETLGARFSAFSVAGDGTLRDWRVWAQLAETPPSGPLDRVLATVAVAPHGCALDAEGHIWAADAVGGRAIRVAPDGDVVDERRPPGDVGVFACMLGGEAGDTLLLCTAPDVLGQRRTAARDAVLMTTKVDVSHAGLP
jgi:sugar lactone lactonase YvrE